MKKERTKRKPTTLQALIPIVAMFVILGVGYGVLKLKTEPLILIAAIIAGCMAYYLGYSWKEMQDAIVEKIANTMPAMLILWSVGLLVAGMMFCGAVPMIIYYGIQIVNPQFMLLTSFLGAALLSVVTGTSWGSAGTIGVAMMGIAGGLGVSLPATAGAVVSGAYFGDKLSPLSDTTNLAPMAAGSELYEHIKHMLYTTIPATLLAMAIYIILGLNTTVGSTVSETAEIMKEQLSSMFNFNPIILLPMVVVILGSIVKWPTLPTMAGAGFLGIILGVVVQGFSLTDGFTALVSGFNVSMTGFSGEAAPEIVSLLNRGGVNSMMGTSILVFAAMCFAGIVSVSGMLDKVLELLLKRVKGTAGLVCSTIAACFIVALTTGNSYLTILIPGQLFRDAYKRMGLAAKNLSRTLEDSGTVLVPLIPWSSAGAYMAATLGVEVLQYLPYAVLCYSGIVMAIICACTGFGIAKLKPEEEKN